MVGPLSYKKVLFLLILCNRSGHYLILLWNTGWHKKKGHHLQLQNNVTRSKIGIFERFKNQKNRGSFGSWSVQKCWFWTELRDFVVLKGAITNLFSVTNAVLRYFYLYLFLWKYDFAMISSSSILGCIGTCGTILIFLLRYTAVTWPTFSWKDIFDLMR